MQEVVIYTPGQKGMIDLITFCFTNPLESLVVFGGLVGFMLILNWFISRR
jgi:hypothetical protein